MSVSRNPLRTVSSSNTWGPSVSGFEVQLPRPISTFIGREVAGAELLALITNPDLHLVTLTGTGGIGKTRLAIQVARQAADQFRDGVVFVRLADVREPSLVPTTIAHALGIHDAIGAAMLDRIHHACRDAHLLLVVDNLEHLLDAAVFLSAMLAQCPGITVLATSRQRLMISGERVFELDSLALDHAIALFVQRAQAIAPRFTLTDESRMDIAEICGHLDGLPLAIELAAARVPMLPPHAMRDRIGNRMELLRQGMRDAPSRHHGIREAIAWSYDLLTKSQQGLFRRLSVFEGGFTIEAAAAISAIGDDVLSGVSALESGSLLKLRPDQHGGERFFMLETIREFALERLREHGEESRARQDHAAHIARLADDTERVWWESGGLDKLDELEPELPNIRAALAWMQHAGDVPELLRLAGSLAPVWGTRGYSVEGQAWLEWALPRSDGTPVTTVMVALRALAWVLIQHDDYYRSLLIAQHALALAEEIGDARSRVGSLTLSGLGAGELGHPDLAMGWYTTALEILDSCAGEAWAPVSRCILMDHLGGLALGMGDIEQAETWYTRMRATLDTLGFRFAHASHVDRGLGDIARARGDPVRALGRYQVSLHDAVEAHDIRAIARVLGSIAGALSAMGHHDVAGRLFGASEALHERIAVPFVSRTFARQRAFGLPEPWASMHPECTVADGLRRTLRDRTAKLRAVTLDAERARAWWAEGRSLDLDAAISLAFAMEPGQNPREKRPGGLSPREIEVLRLLAQGHTDREIAALLHVSPRTVQNHVQHIYGKIEVTSRSAATKWSLVRGIA